MTAKKASAPVIPSSSSLNLGRARFISAHTSLSYLAPPLIFSRLCSRHFSTLVWPLDTAALPTDSPPRLQPPLCILGDRFGPSDGIQYLRSIPCCIQLVRPNSIPLSCVS